MLRTIKRLLGVVGVAVLCACGGSTADVGDAGDAGQAVKDAGKPDAPGQPPPPTDGGPPTTQTMTFALHTLFLGETDRTGTPSTTAWKSFGFNLDGLVTDKASTDVCTLVSGSPKTNQTDGTNGNDNAWGETLLPIVETAASQPAPSQTASGVIDSGGWTVQIAVTGLSSDPNQTATGLSAQIFSSGAYDNGVPSFDSTTDWPVLATSINDGQTIASGSVAQFKSAYVTNGTFVSGPGPDPLVLNLNISGIALTFNVHAAIVTFDHGTSDLISNGTIAGTLDTQELVASLQKIAGQFSTALCGTAFNGIAQQIEQASDILVDGTNTAGTTCNAISIGLGFEARLVANPTKVSPPPSPPPDPCQ